MIRVKTVIRENKDCVTFAHVFTKEKKIGSTVISIMLHTAKDIELVLVETSSRIFVIDTNLNLIETWDVEVKNIHVSPFDTEKIAYLTTKNELCIDRNTILENVNYDGFDFQFSPFVLSLYNSENIVLKDLRQAKDRLLHISSSRIKQVLPLDCCFSFAVSCANVEIYDCRYWKLLNSFTHYGIGDVHLVSFPTRSFMYKNGMICDQHQKLYGISQVIEEYTHKKYDSFQDLIFELSPSRIQTPVLHSSISYIPIFNLNAAFPLTGKNKNIWLQSSDNGGLLIESHKHMDISSVINELKFSEARKLKTVKFYDKKNILENLINEECKLNSSEKPKLLVAPDVEFEDFEDEN